MITARTDETCARMHQASAAQERGQEYSESVTVDGGPPAHVEWEAYGQQADHMRAAYPDLYDRQPEPQDLRAGKGR
jgi:hypothetical protein